MSFSRAVVSVASTFLGLSAAAAQQPETPYVAAPPVFQSLMVDAQGKTVGRLFLDYNSGNDTVVRQIRGTWVEVLVDTVVGFPISDPSNLGCYFQSIDCTGQAYLLVNARTGTPATLPALGIVTTIPPSTQPSIYFAGPPVGIVTIASRHNVGDICRTFGGASPLYVGPAQSVPVSSLGLTPPFSIK
jgi:hypothetical protein